MKRKYYNWYPRNTKDHKRLLWTTVCRKTGQPKRNGKILRCIQPTKPDQKEIANLNIPITSKETESVIKNLPMKKAQDQTDGFTGKFYQTFKEELMPVLLRLFQKLEEDGILQTHFMRPAIPWYQSQKRTTRRENYRPISLTIHRCKIFQ